jgi:hypothetical protein
VLAIIIVMLFAAIVVFLVRDARHRGRHEMMDRVLYQVQQDRILWLDFFSARREAERFWQPQEAEEAANAARRGVSAPLPLSARHHLVPDEQKHLQTFGPPSPSQVATLHSSGNEYPADLNPFEDAALSIANENFVEICPDNVAPEEGHPRREEIFEPGPHQEERNKQPTVLVVQAQVHTATVRRTPSQRRKRAPPPPTLPKPKLQTSEAGNATLPRRPPSPPKRSSSLRSLHGSLQGSLRRSKNVDLQTDSKPTLPSKFMEKNDLYSDDQQFISFVTEV